MGMNRDAMWTPEQWVALGDLIHARLKLKILFMGAPYDLSYCEKYLEPLRNGRDFWVSHVGAYPFCTSLAVVKQARFMIGHASGFPIAAHYAGAKVVTWWRPYGNSLDPKFHISFNEGMATAWAKPAFRQNLHANIYGRCTPESLLDQVKGW